MTEKADHATIKRQMAAAVAAYVGPVTKCPAGVATAEVPVKLLPGRAIASGALRDASNLL